MMPSIRRSWSSSCWYAWAAETAPVAAWKIWTRIVMMITSTATVTSISTRVTPLLVLGPWLQMSIDPLPGNSQLDS